MRERAIKELRLASLAPKIFMKLGPAACWLPGAALKGNGILLMKPLKIRGWNDPCNSQACWPGWIEDWGLCLHSSWPTQPHWSVLPCAVEVYTSVWQRVSIACFIVRSTGLTRFSMLSVFIGLEHIWSFSAELLWSDQIWGKHLSQPNSIFSKSKVAEYIFSSSFKFPIEWYPRDQFKGWKVESKNVLEQRKMRCVTSPSI